MIKIILKHSLLVVIGVLLFSFLFLLYTSDGKAPAFNVGSEFSYAKEISLKNNSFKRARSYISLKDSTKIAITYLLPEKENVAGYPIVLLASPYTSSVFVPEMKWYERAFSKWETGSWGPEYDFISQKSIKTYTSNGYAVVLMDLRGTGSSTGFASPGDTKYIDDFTEVFNYLEMQPWSNGKIGMEGQSYLGWTQFAAASTKHPALKCIAPGLINVDAYSDNIRPGGIKNIDWIESYSTRLKNINSSFWSTDGELPIFPSVPLTDMDGDGQFLDEIPELKENEQLVLNTNSITYKDGIERPNNPYISMLKERHKSISFSDLAASFEYIDDTLYFDDRLGFFQGTNPINLIAELKKTKIPVLFIGGFFDYFEGIPQLYSSLKNTNPSYLFMGPRFHIPADIPASYKELFGYKNSYSDAQFIHTLRFLDHYLKDINNGFEKELPVKIYTPFEGWNNFSTWPIEEALPTKFYLTKDVLTEESEKSLDTLQYNVDFTHRASYGEHALNPNNALFVMNDVLERSAQDSTCLVFETAPLNVEKILTGYPIINLNISSNRSNADVYVYLTDVAPDGKAYYIAEAQLRAGWHRLADNDELVDGAFDVEPELPWQSYKRDHYDPEPFKNGTYQKLKFNLKPHSWKFKKGHKIRISIAGADKDNFEFNPDLCPENTFDSCMNTDLYIVTGGTDGSFIELPIMEVK